MRRRPTAQRADGFTLVEVLVVLVVSAFIVVLLAEATRSGTANVATLDRRGAENDRFIAVDALLRSLIRQAVPTETGEPPGLAGSPHRLVLRTVLPVRPSGLRTAAVDASIEVVHGSLDLVWRTRYPSRPFLPLPIHQEVLLDGVAAVEFGFASSGRGGANDRPEWLNTWVRPALPALVRIRVAREPGRATSAWPDIVAAPAPLAART